MNKINLQYLKDEKARQQMEAGHAYLSALTVQRLATLKASIIQQASK